MLRPRLLSLAVMVAAAATHAAAAPVLLLQPGIPSFDTNLGTLLSATVTLDPPAQITGAYDAGPFENFNSHNHFVNPLPIVVPGLDTYDFPPTPTSFINPPAGATHSHVVNLPPIVETYTGVDLVWFLDPNNGVGALPLNAPPTSVTDNHQHPVNFLPVLPRTRFLYEPTTVPEPAAAVLCLGGLALAGFRRR